MIHVREFRLSTFIRSFRRTSAEGRLGLSVSEKAPTNETSYKTLKHL